MDIRFPEEPPIMMTGDEERQRYDVEQFRLAAPYYGAEKDFDWQGCVRTGGHMERMGRRSYLYVQHQRSTPYSHL